MKKWFLSSTGSGDLSLTIKGLLVGLLPLIMAVIQLTGHDIAQGQVEEFITAVTGAIASIAVVLGMVRKIVYALTNK
jgi:hypothetical protein